MTGAERACPRELHPDSAGNLSDHETPADHAGKRQAIDLTEGLPGVSIVSNQCDDAEQHRRRCKDEGGRQKILVQSRRLIIDFQEEECALSKITTCCRSFETTAVRGYFVGAGETVRRLHETST